MDTVGETLTEQQPKSLAWQLADAHGIDVRQLGLVLSREYGPLLAGAEDAAQKALDLAAALPYVELQDIIHVARHAHPEAFK